jgi:hypothetical protein
MASTVNNSTLSVTLTEKLTLNGVEQGSSNKMKIGGVNEVSKRILTTLTTGTQIYQGHASVAANGQFIYGNVKYIRITNLDDTNSVAIHIEDSGNSHDAQFLLPAGHSFFLTDAESSYGSATSVAIPTGNIERIDAMASTAVVDIEIMIASA